MVVINYNSREVSCKIVYYGPGLSGKTTNLVYVHGKVPGTTRGDLISLATDADRTLYFDFLPINIGDINGFTTKFQLYTVPGQVFYNATRKLVLRGVDGLIFVADSQRDKADENVESLNNLKENLEEYGIDINKIPLALQYNKRDLPEVMTVEELDKLLNTGNWKTFEACANKGSGVFDTLKYVIKLVLDKAKKSPQGMQASEMARVEDAQLSSHSDAIEQENVVEDAPSMSEQEAQPAQKPVQPSPQPTPTPPPMPTESVPSPAEEPQKVDLAASSETPSPKTQPEMSTPDADQSQDFGHAETEAPAQTQNSTSEQEQVSSQSETGVAVAEDEDPIARAARELEEAGSQQKPEPQPEPESQPESSVESEQPEPAVDEEPTEIIHNDQSMGMFDKNLVESADERPAPPEKMNEPDHSPEDMADVQPPEIEKPKEEKELYERLPEIAEAEEKMCSPEIEQKTEDKPSEVSDSDDDSVFKVPTMQKSLKARSKKKKGFFLFRWLFGKR